MIDELRQWAMDILTGNETDNSLARANARELLDLPNQVEGRTE